MEAKDGDKKQKSSEEDVGTSLFHRRLAHRMLLNPQEEMKFLLHRLVVIGGISPELADKRDLGGHYEKLNQRLQRHCHGDGFTGLLLLYPSHLVHVVESSSEVLVSVLQDLSDMKEQSHSALIVEPRVLVVSHDLPSRIFQDWRYKVLDLPATTLTSATRKEPIGKLISDALTLLLKLGDHLLKSGKDLKTSLESLQEKAPELIVPQDVLAQLLEREELLTPQQYLQVYHSPISIPIDSRHVFGSCCPATV
ncbi:testis-expressed protein 47 [Megalops cyprinoides]|uniref:testis-expressed protein 47 n=1 Tax=Megalops cyprinoides TaxID=118141 RepID=UPI001863A333|nr:testis-expressed protein 47 [Megalops cyprinoides]